MNHNIKKGDTVKCIVDDPNSEIRLGDTFIVHYTSPNFIFDKDYRGRLYSALELVKPTLIHQQWKDLYDKGVELEWCNCKYNVWCNLTAYGRSARFNEPDYLYRVKDLGYDYYKHQLDKINLSFMVNKDIVVETYGLLNLAKAFADRGYECGASDLRKESLTKFSGIDNLNKCFGLVAKITSHSSLSYYKSKNYTILSFQELLDHPKAQKCLTVENIDNLEELRTAFKNWPPEANQQGLKPKQTKENTMKHNFKKGDIIESLVEKSEDTRMIGTLHEVTEDNSDLLWYKANCGVALNTTSYNEFKLHRPNNQKPKENTMNPLDLILLSIFQQKNQPKDATNANHIAILTEQNGTFVGYIYADDSADFDEVMRKPENETRKLHIFNYEATIAQKPRKIVKVDRV